MLNKRITAIFLIFVLLFTLTSCGDNNYMAEDVIQEEPETPVIEETEDTIPVEEGEVKQTVTIKAGPDGTPISAKLRTSGDDLEETVETDKLPFGVKIRYYLEGKEITADEIAGATGNIRIRFDYENKAETTVSVNGKDVSTKVPLAFVSLVTVPEDRLYNVKVNSGGMTETAGNRVIYGYALPGIEEALKLSAAKEKIKSLGSNISFEESESIPEYLEITGYASDFEMDFSATLVTNGLLKDSEESGINDISDMINDLGELGDGGNELSDGISELKNGAAQFGSGLDKYVEGAGSLKEGTDMVSGGMSKLSEGAKSLKDGAAGLSSGLSELKGSGENLNSLASGLNEGIEALLEEYSSSQGDVPEDEIIDAGTVSDDIAAGTKQAVMEALSGNETLTDDEKTALAEAAGVAAKEKAFSQLSSINGQSGETESDQSDLTPMIQGLLEASSGLKDGVAAYTGGVSQAASGASVLSDGASQLASGIDELSGGISELVKGADVLTASGKALSKGYDALESGIGTLKDGIDEINRDVFQKIGSLSYGALPDTIEGLKAMRIADKGFTAWDTYDGKEGSIVFILETE